jgi:hypothetical protein
MSGSLAALKATLDAAEATYTGDYRAGKEPYEPDQTPIYVNRAKDNLASRKAYEQAYKTYYYAVSKRKRK